MLVVFLFALLPALSFLLILFVISNRKKFKKRGRRKTPKVKFNGSPLQEEFVRLLGGDVATAKRLVAHEKSLNPGRKENWYWEKAIWRLERDRRVWTDKTPLIFQKMRKENQLKTTGETRGWCSFYSCRTTFAWKAHPRYSLWSHQSLCWLCGCRLISPNKSDRAL